MKSFIFLFVVSTTYWYVDADPVCTATADVGFILDSSGSIGDNYQKEKDFIKDLAMAFGISKKHAHAGVVTFSWAAQLSIRLNQYYNTALFNKAVDKIKHMRSITRIDLALKAVKEKLFNPKFGARAKVPKLLVMVTDGKHTRSARYTVRNKTHTWYKTIKHPDPVPIARALRKSGVHIIVIGIGDESQIDVKELKTYSPEVYTATNFNILLSRQFIGKITKKMCASEFVHQCDKKGKGGCSQLCQKKGKKWKCKCEVGYKLRKDGKTCLKIHPCDKKNKAGCKQICKKKGNGFTCACRKGFKLKGDKKSCKKVHPCDKDANGGCSQVCKKKGNGFTCACRKGFKLKKDKKTCKKVHPCDKARKGGCAHTCNKKGESAICSCRKGYILNKDGKTCKKVHPCDKKDNAACSQICNKKKNHKFECACKDGFKLAKDKTSCKKVHPCDKNDNAGCDQICKKTGDGFSCACRKGYKLKKDKKTCKKVHPCDKSNNAGCGQICKKKGDGFHCACRKGYKLKKDKKTCKKVHPCDKARKGGCAHTCNKKGEGYLCSCRRGYILKKDGRTCKKVHPCDKKDNAGCSQICNKKKNHKFECACKYGFQLAKDKKSCKKIHPCDLKKNGGCSQVCVKKGAVSKCSCGVGFQLAGDKKTCIKVRMKQCLKTKTMVKLGCFLQIVAPLCKQKEIVNLRANWEGNWKPVAAARKVAEEIVCKCFELAAKKGHKYFSIRNSGECLTGNPDQPKRLKLSFLDPSLHAAKGKCFAANGKFQACDDKSANMCIGGPKYDYVYLIQDKCRVNNGGCSHMCQEVPYGVVCLCRYGYKLQADNKACKRR